MSGKKIFVTRRIPQLGLDLLAEGGADFTVGVEQEEQLVSRELLLDGVRGADVLLSLLTEAIDREVMEANPNLIGIANYAVGFNNIDIETATELGLPVTNTPGVLTDTTADLAWALLMATARQIPQAHNYMVGGHYKTWGPNLFLGGDISHGGAFESKTLGVVGYGRIGQGMHKRSSGFDMKVIAHDPYAKELIENTDGVEWRELDDLMGEADFVTLHTLLTDETRHLINADRLSKMKSTAYLVNTSRGPVIHEAALVEALRGGQLAGAGLDVFEDEPAMAAGLNELDNVVLLPHIASASIDTRAKMATMAATNALAHLSKEKAPQCLNPEVYETEAYKTRITD